MTYSRSYQALFFNCLLCKKKKYVNKYKLEHNEGKYCSRKCKNIDQKGKHFSVATQFKKGQTAGDKNTKWKGDKVKYRALHMWITAHKGKPSMCENQDCVYPRNNSRGKLLVKPKRFEWANISHAYKRDLTDWMSLCSSCHWRYDHQ